MTPQELWAFLPFGYLFSVLIETPILLVGLSPRHSWKRRLFAGVWLTACTYPTVILVLPMCIDAAEHRTIYLAAAETFAPLAECVLFWAAFGMRQEWGRWSMWRDFLVITLANLASFGGGELMYYLGGVSFSGSTHGAGQSAWRWSMRRCSRFTSWRSRICTRWRAT